MYRGTTPTLIFTLPIDTASITLLNVTMAQNDRVMISRSLDDVGLAGTKVTVTLTEAETLRLRANTACAIQLRVGVGESRMASQIFTVPVEKILKDGMLNEV